MKVYINGEFRDANEPALLVSDHGFTVGDAVFETIKTIDSVPYALTRHLERLSRSAAGLGLPMPPNDLGVAIGELLTVEPLKGLGRIRVTWSGGPGPAGSLRAHPLEPTLVISHTSAPTPALRARVVTVPYPRNERSPLSGIKSTSYAENVLALSYARERGGDEAIFADTQGRLAEGSGSNIIIFDGINFITPSLDCGVLAGTARGLAIEWFGVHEGEIPLHSLTSAKSVLLTSSLRDLQLVSHVDGVEVAVTQDAIALSEEFSARLLKEVDPR